VPLVDVEETSEQFIVRAELPGMKKDDISISVTGSELSLSGERKQEETTRDRTYHRIERTYGKFRRDMTLPTEVDSSKVSARYVDGILEIFLPKSEEVKPREISISVE
jgi:HSP20 family protein